MPLGMEIGFGPGDFVLDGIQLPITKKGRTPQFLAHVCCGQTARWIEMALGTVVGLGPGHIVLVGFPAKIINKITEDIIITMMLILVVAYDLGLFK